MTMNDDQTANDDSWLDAEITRQLQLVTDDDLTKDDDVSDVEDIGDDVIPVNDIDDVEFSQFLELYQKRPNNLIGDIESQLNDLDTLITERNKSHDDDEFDPEIRDLAKSTGQEPSEFCRDILTKLDDDDKFEPSGAKNAENETDGKPDLSGDKGALVEYCESDELERKFRDQMNDWLTKQKEKENLRTIENEQNYAEIRDRLTKLETRREDLLAAMKKDEISLEEVKNLRAAEIEIEEAETHQLMKEEECVYVEKLKTIELNLYEQVSYVEKLKTEARNLDEGRRNRAATKIQSLFRGYQARKEYGETVNEWIEHGRKKREEQRVRDIEVERRRREVEERKRIEAEQHEKRQQEMERLREEEKRRKEALERKKKEEEERLKQEQLKRAEEEREKKLEEERLRMLEAERKAKEELQKIEEEKRHQEEERKRIELAKEEELRKAEEERQREEERRKKEEEDRKKQEEEKRLKEIEEEKRRKEAEEEKRRKEAEEKQRKEAEGKAKEDAKQKAEQEEREQKEAEEIRKEIERKAHEEKRKLEQEKRIEEEEHKKKIEKLKNSSQPKVESNLPMASPRSKVSAEDKPESLSDQIQKSRLAWMQSCIPLSKIMMEAKSRKTTASTIPKRRPSSSKKLQNLPDKLIFTDGLSDSYDEITSVELTDLPGYNLQPLSSCVHLTTVEISNCQIILLDAFVHCAKLRMLRCRNSKVEVINLKKLTELVYLDLSGNQIASIHGLDGCANLRYLNLSKNRITKIENLVHNPKLHTLILEHNSITRLTNISEAPNLQILRLSRNNIRKIVEIEKLGLLSYLDLSHNSLDSIPILTNHVLLRNLNFANNGLSDITAFGVFWLPLLEEMNLSANSIESLPKFNGTISLKKLNLSENNIAGLKDILPNLTNCTVLNELCVSGNPELELVENSRTLICEALPQLSELDGKPTKNQRVQKLDSDYVKFCESQIRTLQTLEDKYSEKLSEVPKTQPDGIASIHTQYFEKSHALVSDFRYAHEYGDIKVDVMGSDFFQFTIEKPIFRPETPAKASSSNPKLDLKSMSQTLVTDAKSKFEEALGPKPQSSTKNAKDLFEAAVNGSTKSSHFIQPELLREKSAVKIQSLYRGHLCRKRLAMACEMVRGLDDDDISNLDEIDIDAWDVDIQALDEDWQPAAVPQIVNSSPVLKPIPKQPREAWQHVAAKPPPSPAPSSADMDTHRTKASKMSELTEEWGFKDARTADLMLRRARKLKYDAVRRKKLSQLDPKQRLVLMRRLEENTHLPQVQPPRRPAPQRRDYFRAKQEDADKQKLERAAENRNKMNRMYEWLHTAADTGSMSPMDTRRTLGNVAHRPPSGGLKRTGWAGSDGSLPRVDTDPSRLNDQLTLRSVESDLSSRRFSHDGILPHKRPLPAIKTNSAPGSAQERKTSQPEMGWGGGKKRHGKRAS